MRDFHNMKQSITGDDPLSREIVLFKKKREQADMIEQIFRNIKNNYNRTDISAMKNNIDKKLSQVNPVFNTMAANNYFSRLRNDLSNRAFQSPEFTEDQIIHPFTVDETRGRTAAYNRPMSPVTIGANSMIVRPNPPIKVNTESYPSQTVPILVQTELTEPPKFVNQERLTPSRDDRVVSSHVPPPNRPKSPKTVTFDLEIPDGKQIVRGKQPQAKVSPEKNEAQINYKLSNPRLNHLKSIHLNSMTGVPISLKSFDSRNLAVGCADGSLKILDIVSSSVVKQYKFTSKVKVIEAIEDNGRTGLRMGALVGLGAPDNAIALIDLEQGENAQAIFKCHSDEVSGIINLGNGDFISSSNDGTIVYWDMASQSPLNRINAHNGRVNGITTLNNHNTLVSGGDDMCLQVFSVRRGEIIHKNTLREASPVILVNSFYGNSKFAFSCQMNGTIRIWNVETGEYVLLI